LNVSEELYLLGIALVFLALSLFLGLEIWVVHNSFFESTVWTDIFSSSIFLVLTILLLSWLLRVREMREWNKVKFLVDRRMQSVVNDLSETIIGYIEFRSKPLISKARENMNSTIVTFTKLFRASYLVDNKELQDRLCLDYWARESGERIPNDEGSYFFEDESFKKTIRPSIRRISWIEDAYFRFLSPDFAFLLVQIHQDLDQILDTEEITHSRIRIKPFAERYDKIQSRIKENAHVNKEETEYNKWVEDYLTRYKNDYNEAMNKFISAFHGLLSELCILYGILNKNELQNDNFTRDLLDKTAKVLLEERLKEFKTTK
jgi:hypothetical protein